MNPSIINVRPSPAPAPRLPGPRPRRPGEILNRLALLALPLGTLVEEFIDRSANRPRKARRTATRRHTAAHRPDHRGSVPAWARTREEVDHG
jgi:hypothetical protein